MRWSLNAGKLAGIPIRIHVAIAVLLGVAVAGAAEAQYFGQNKVRAKAPDFKVLETEHFDIHYYDEKRDAAAEAGRMAERWHARLSAVFGGRLSSRQPIVLYASHADFRGTTVVPDDIGETTGGLTEASRRRIVMPLAGPLSETDHVLGHELVHAFQFDIINKLQRQDAAGSAAFNLPLWFVEGMAEYLSVGPVDVHTAMWIRDGIERNTLPALAALDSPRYFPYRWGHAFWAYVAQRFGDRSITPLLTAAAATGDPLEAVELVLKTKPEELSEAWHNWLKEAHGTKVTAATRHAASARPLLGGHSKVGRLNVGPAISPDGRLVAFYSERDQTAVNLFLAEADTGKLRRKLTEAAVDPHVDSLQFVNAAGAWSHDGRRLAFTTVAAGQPQLNIYDVEADKVERRIPLREVSEVFSATWSPNGRSITLSAMANGNVDLFLLDVAGTEGVGAGRQGSHHENRPLTRLTNDAYAELQPAWSPDGRRIAYVTDRFTTDLAKLAFGELRLAVIDPATRASSPLTGFETGKHLNPHWSRNGDGVFFVADHAGLPNVYRLSLDSGRIEQVTSATGGVTGIGKMSPALSVAARADKLAFSAFENGGYQVYIADVSMTSNEMPGLEPQLAQDATTQAPNAGPDAAREDGAVPPGLQHQSVTGSLFGAPDGSAFRSRSYRPKLSLEAFAPLQAGVGIGELGPFVTGGTAVRFSDLLGHHNLTIGASGGSFGGGRRFFDNLSIVGGYQNQASRWTWGITGGQSSNPTTRYASGAGLVGSEPAWLDSEIRTWEIGREVNGLLWKPLSRARRLEFSAGFQNLSFRAESRTQAVSALTGELLGEDRLDLPTPRSLNMATTQAAVVHDTSLFGGTSPVMGERYRLQVGAAAGSVNYVTVLADYRRYVRLGGPFSLAGRVMHYGRYGSGAEDIRLPELFVGYPHLVRGYNGNPFESGECGLAARCRSYDQLFGSRIAVANVELRTSISGYRGLLSALAIPIEAAVFVDAGLPWSSRRLETSLDRTRRAVSSIGASLRFNIFGSAVGQVSYVYANDRPLKKWRWEFSLTPGF